MTEAIEFYREAVGIREKFEETRSRWNWDEIDWNEMERVATELSEQFKEAENKYKVDWTKLGEDERHIPRFVSCLRISLGMYTGPRNLRGPTISE